MIHPLNIPPFEITSGVLLPDRRQDFKGFSSTSMFFRSPVTRFPSSPCDIRKLQSFRGAFLLTKSHVEWLQHWHVIIEKLSIKMQEHMLNIQYTYLLAVSVKSEIVSTLTVGKLSSRSPTTSNDLNFIHIM